GRISQFAKFSIKQARNGRRGISRERPASSNLPTHTTGTKRMTGGGPNTPLIKAIEKSGYPFELAVERELRDLGKKHDWPVVMREVPVGDSFADLVLQRPGLLLVVESKRVEDETWC